MSVAKNASFMTLASVGQKIISFVYFTMIARYIGPEGTGKYFFALSFTTIAVVFVDLGLTNVLIREAARAKAKIQSYFSTVLSAKLVLGVVTYGGAVLAINLLGYPVETRHLVYLSAVTMLFDSIHLTMYGVLRSIGDLKYEAISIVGSQAITLALGTTFLWLGLPLIYLIFAFTVASFFNVLFVGLVLHKKYQIKAVPRKDTEVLTWFLRIALPFAIAAIFARVYSYVDSILLSKLAGDTAVGWYAIAYKITFAFQFVPLALVAALYPRFSEHYENNKQKLRVLFEQGMKYLWLVAFPIAVGIGVLAHDIVLTIYSDAYEPAILPLQILVASLVFSYISFPIGAFLNACNRQVTQTVIVGLVMVLNIVLNVLLIPVYGVVGAAIAAFAGNVLLTVLGYMFVPQITNISHSFIFKSLMQIGVAAGVMGVAVWYVNLFVPFFLAIPVGAVVYVVMLFVVRAVTFSQLVEVKALLKK